MGLGIRDLLGQQSQELQDSSWKRVELQGSNLGSTETFLLRGESLDTSLCWPKVSCLCSCPHLQDATGREWMGGKVLWLMLWD